MSDLAEQIDALLAINATGKVSHPVPGLAVELLTKAAEALRAAPAPVPVTITPEMVERLTSTCEALRRRGLVEHAGGDRPFLSGWRDNQIVRITPAGRQVLSGSKE